MGGIRRYISLMGIRLIKIGQKMQNGNAKNKNPTIQCKCGVILKNHQGFKLRKSSVYIETND